MVENMESFDINDEIELIGVPKPANSIDEEIKLYENFIDLQFEKARYTKLKEQIFGDVLEKVMSFVRREVITSSAVSSRTDKKKTSQDENTILISHMEDEISFLREEVHQKNCIIKNMTEKSLMHDEKDFSYKTQNITYDQNTLATRKNYIDVTQSQRDDIKQLLNDQLIAIRLKKHNEFIARNNEMRVNKNSKTIVKALENKSCALNNQLSTDFDNNFNSVGKKINSETDTSRSRKKKILIVGDSMLNGIKENGFRNDKFEVDLKYFSGAKASDIANKMDTLLNKKPDCVVLHVGTNNAPIMTSSGIIGEILSIKHRIEKELPNAKVVISTPIIRTDNGKAALTIKNLNQHIRELDIEIIENSNITFRDLGKKGLHLAKYGKSKLVENMMKKLSKLF